ncbi:PPE family protein [Mycobacterium paraffinicum]|uniref:PPE domain-containing protein n=1 Tax=Mycobacterium paraffinicum TaxID=53378 RepID=A0ABP8RQA1_9MYCO|nr:PPE family protein [Mycobacterium paraffinicum]MCV7310029.1 PPE family protein [Mycobacterium paraffinicum]
MDFGALPPEINTARMYSGPGPASLLSAATTWQRLADHLREAATKYLVSAGLLDGLRGPAAVQMGDTTAPYIAWLQATAAVAEQTAARAGAAADAYEWALAATAPPQTIAANRALRRSLAATNHLRQNTPAIASAEGHYDQLWAQNVAAMYAYATAAAAASTLTPFTSPPVADDGDEVISAGAELVSMLPAALDGLSSASCRRFRKAVLSMSSPLSKLSSLPAGFARQAGIPLAVAIGAAAAKAGWGNRAAVLVDFGRAISIGGLSAPRAWLPAAKPNAVGRRPTAPEDTVGGAPRTHTGL